MSIVHADLYEPGCRTPQPPIKRWKAPSRKIPASQRPITAQCRGPKVEPTRNPLATTQVGTQIPRVVPLSAPLAHAIMQAGGATRTSPNNEEEDGGEGNQRQQQSPVFGMGTQRSVNGGVPCADATQDPKKGRQYLATAERPEFQRYDYTKFTRVEGHKDTAAVGPGAGVETFVDRSHLADLAEQEEQNRPLFEQPQVRRRSPTKAPGTIAGGPAPPQRDPNFINRYLYTQVTEAQQLQHEQQQKKQRQGGGEFKVTRPTSASTVGSGAERMSKQYQRLLLLRQQGMPGVGSTSTPSGSGRVTNTPNSARVGGKKSTNGVGASTTCGGGDFQAMTSREAREYFKQLTQQEEAALYAVEVEKARMEGLGQKPAMRLHDLKVKTFDDNMPRNPAHAQLEDDIVRDDFLLKRKRVREGELERRAQIEEHVKTSRASHQEKMRWSFERSLALGLPYTAAKAQDVITREWAAQMEEDAISKGYNMNTAAKEQQRVIAGAKAANVLSGVRSKLRAQQPSFGITPKAATAEAGLSFLRSPQERPQGLKLLGVESQRIVHLIKKRVPLKPPHPQLTCDLTSAKSKTLLNSLRSHSNVHDCPIEVEEENEIRGVRNLPGDEFFTANPTPGGGN